MARELHDIIGHRMTAIVLQAGAARRVWESDPGQPRAALRAIESVGRDARARGRRSQR
jgi:signal transduction histidine kinase